MNDCLVDLDRPQGFWKKQDQELRALLTHSPRVAELAEAELAARRYITRRNRSGHYMPIDDWISDRCRGRTPWL